MTTQSVTLQYKDMEVFIDGSGIHCRGSEKMGRLFESIIPVPDAYTPDLVRYIAEEFKKRFPKYSEVSCDWSPDKKDSVY